MVQQVRHGIVISHLARYLKPLSYFIFCLHCLIDHCRVDSQGPIRRGPTREHHPGCRRGHSFSPAGQITDGKLRIGCWGSKCSRVRWPCTQRPGLHLSDMLKLMTPLTRAIWYRMLNYSEMGMTWPSKFKSICKTGMCTLMREGSPYWESLCGSVPLFVNI